ncbi:MAG: hypothetical protein IJ323_00690 [Clostridia bacterium]|nr:hypothetical protein [Clostridia bacterium]
MKRILHSKIFYYTLYSLLFFAVIFYLDSIPDHRVGYSDYDLYLTWAIFPILFMVHGVISKIVFREHKLYLPLIFTAVLGFIEAFINASNLKSACLTTLYYVILTFVGALIFGVIFWVVVWIIESIRGIKDWYK